MGNLKQCATHGLETANCGPLCSPMQEAPAPRRRRTVEVKSVKAVDGPERPIEDVVADGLAERETDEQRPIIDGGADDDPATPE